MITIGIDMSKNSPGVCIREDDKLSFLSFIRSDENTNSKAFKKKIAPHYEALRECGVKIISNSRSSAKLEYSESEIWKLEDAFLLAKSIVDSLPEKADMVGMEGFSYGSKGNSGLDIAGYAYCVRGALLQKYGKEKLCIFSPGAVKKTGGKGNANKDQMMEFFLHSQDTILRNSGFWKGLSDGTLNKMMKPCDDLVDSWWVCETTRLYFLKRQ